jgi:hypothetical protein
MGIIKEEKLRSDCTRTGEASLPCSTPKFSLTRTGKVIIGFFGSWLGFIILIKIVTMVIRALSND